MFEFQLHDVGPELLGGRLVQNLADARDALRFYRDFCADTRDELIVYGGLATGSDGDPRTRLARHVGPAARPPSPFARGACGSVVS